MIIERIYFASIEQSNAVNAAAKKETNQRLMASFYADCIISDAQASMRGLKGVDWPTVNAAITARWPKGLARIKNAAWKLIEKASVKP